MSAYVKYNHSYFRNIDTGNKAYFLGLMVANASISDKYVQIAVHENHSIILDKLLDEIQSGETSRRVKIVNHEKTSRIKLYHPSVISDLKEKGIIGRKKDRKPYHIDKYVDYYIRGLYDGGGCLSTEYKTGNSTMFINCSKPVLIYIQNQFNDKLSIKPNKIYENKSNSFEMKYRSRRDVLNITNYLYGDTNSIHIPGRIVQ